MLLKNASMILCAVIGLGIMGSVNARFYREGRPLCSPGKPYMLCSFNERAD